jgi:hypothetical protein
MFAENRVFLESDPDGPTTPALRRRLADAGRFVVTTAKSLSPACGLCGCNIAGDPEADLNSQLCGSCKNRPEAKRLGGPAPGNPEKGIHVMHGLHSARQFTEAEKALVRKIHGYVPPQQLLGILNERLKGDLGPNVSPYTTEQLHAEIAAIGGSVANKGNDWAGLRKLLAQADRNGTLRLVTEQVIGDFAVIFSLSPKQLMRLKDILLQREED